MVRRPEIGEAEPLGDLGGGIDALPRRVVAERGEDQPVVHSGDPTTPDAHPARLGQTGRVKTTHPRPAA
jgi:hypothetical protein